MQINQMIQIMMESSFLAWHFSKRCENLTFTEILSSDSLSIEK